MLRKSPLRRKTRLRSRGKGRRFVSYVPNREFQDYVRRQGCAVYLGSPEASHWGPIGFAHVKSRGSGGHDEGNGLGLCAKHHAEQHTMGVKSFAKRYRVNLQAVASALWTAFESEQGRNL